MMDSHEINRQPRSAMNSTNGGGVRRRPPTAPYTAASSHSYGTNEEDSLMSPPSHNEEGYPIPQSHTMERRRSFGGGGIRQPWYRQPQKLILVATLAWVGGVMYLATLAHAILRTHKETADMMGISRGGSNEHLKQLLEAREMRKKHGASASDEDVQQWLEARSNKYGASEENDGDFQQWLQSQKSGKYGASAETDGDFKQWLEARSNNYGNPNSGASAETDGDFQQWLQSQNKYGASAETNDDFKQWLESQNNKYGSSGGKVDSGKTNDANVRFGSVGGDAWQDWLSYLESEKTKSNGSYGATIPKGKKTKDENVRFGNGGDVIMQEWLEYQTKNKQVTYNANGMYGKNQKSVNNPPAPRLALESQSLSSEQQQPAVASSDSSISTIDWPLQGLAHVSCTSSNGCSPSTNVTILVVYGPEYHTHISEMAWNVATGIHTAFQSHIRHHPSSPLHGHIVYGHTSNITFLDVIDADAVIIGSPVYNGNVHPDVQNWINYWHIDADLSNKFGGAFATAGGIHAGADGTIMSILRSMMVFQMMAVGGDSWTSPFGAVATMYEDPFGDTQRTEYFDASCYYTEDNGRTGDHLVHPYFLRKAYGLGERIANVTVAWKNSSYVRWS